MARAMTKRMPDTHRSRRVALRCGSALMTSACAVASAPMIFGCAEVLVPVAFACSAVFRTRLAAQLKYRPTKQPHRINSIRRSPLPTREKLLKNQSVPSGKRTVASGIIQFAIIISIRLFII